MEKEDDFSGGERGKYFKEAHKDSRIFILEDDKERLKWFGQFFMQNRVYVTTPKAKTAVEILKVIEFDLIFLDHDLADEHYYEEMYGGVGGYVGTGRPREYDGRYVAKFLAEHPSISTNARIIVHSLNETRAQEMMAILQDGGRYPQRVNYFQLRQLSE